MSMSSKQLHENKKTKRLLSTMCDLLSEPDDPDRQEFLEQVGTLLEKNMARGNSYHQIIQDCLKEMNAAGTSNISQLGVVVKSLLTNASHSHTDRFCGRLKWVPSMRLLSTFSTRHQNTTQQGSNSVKKLLLSTFSIKFINLDNNSWRQRRLRSLLLAKLWTHPHLESDKLPSMPRHNCRILQWLGSRSSIKQLLLPFQLV
jgi:hypothetical protein